MKKLKLATNAQVEHCNRRADEEARKRRARFRRGLKWMLKMTVITIVLTWIPTRECVWHNGEIYRRWVYADDAAPNVIGGYWDLRMANPDHRILSWEWRIVNY